MKLSKLTMFNFRQFYGEAQLEFSCDKNLSLSVIHAENGVGKTTILNAVYWCLYGRLLEQFELTDNLVNDYANSSEGVDGCYVELEFSESGSQYRVRRTYDQSKRAAVAEGFNIVGGNQVPILGIDAVVNRIIPATMAPYFFFHGEGVNSFGSSQGRNSFKDAIRSILGFDHGDQAVSILQTIRLKWQKQAEKLGKIDAAGKAAILKEAEEEENYENASRQFEEVKRNLVFVEDNLEEINQELAKIKVQNVDELNAERRTIEARKREIPRALEEITRARILSISKYGWSIYGHPFLLSSAEILSKFRTERKIPAEYNDIFVNSLLANDECICGTSLKSETAARALVEKMLAGASTSEQEDAVERATLVADSIKNVSDEYIQLLNGYSIKEDELITEKGAIERRLEEIKERLSGIDEPKIRELEASRAEAVRVASNLRDQKHLSGIAKDAARKRADEAKRLKKTKVDKAELGIYQDRLDFVDSVMEVARRVIEEEENSARSEIEELINQRLTAFSRKDYFAEVDREFGCILKKSNGSPVAKSQGEKALLNLSFIASLIQLARERSNKSNEYFVQGTIAPFVIDAPFGELDNKYRGAVAKFLPQSTDQLITLLSSSHWSESVEENMRPYIGKEYVLVSESEGTDEEKEIVDEVEILGRKYPCSKFGVGIPRTVVEEVSI